jgi:hypothetical protein
MTLASVTATYPMLTEHHYLGPTKVADFAWSDEHGCLVFAWPRSRRIPTHWLELVRWCLTGEHNSGSMQWAAFVGWAKQNLNERVTTVVSYSDPSQGHDGALYRACNWLWAPTWLCLRPPPTGNGEWVKGDRQHPKHRWIYPLKPDSAREATLVLNDESLMRRMPWASYREPSWKRGHFDPRTGGGNFQRWKAARG